MQRSYSYQNDSDNYQSGNINDQIYNRWQQGFFWIMIELYWLLEG
jgi:hypothetical protein